jgi:ADP-ribose pyrophosphatase
VLGKQRLYDDFFRIDEARVSFERFERFDGTMSAPIRRLVFKRGDSAAAMVLNRDNDRLLLAEQLRVPTLDKGPGWLIEAMAGIVDAGEDPLTSLERELTEELGFRSERIEHIATFYPSPGGSSERIWLYLVDVSGASPRLQRRWRAGGGRGHPHPGADP